MRAASWLDKEIGSGSFVKINVAVAALYWYLGFLIFGEQDSRP